jgi:hypothetical protein
VPGLKDELRRRAGLYSLRFNIGRRWSLPEPQPAFPDPIPGIRLNAVIATWHEADVIESTVRNAFAQGCERVLVVDNDSPDDTVAVAKAAGAEIARVYSTERYDETFRMAQIAEVIESTSEQGGDDHVWWLVSDADEFCHARGGQSLHDYVAGLDRRFRVVGARVFNHYPTAEPAHLPGRHPLDCQPMCQEVLVAWCSLRHWKHPLLRWDRNGPPVRPANGFHRMQPCAERLGEPKPGVYLHHFQYREREATYERLRRLCEASPDGDRRTALQDERLGRQSGPQRRFATLEHVYAGEWDSVEIPAADGHIRGVTLRPFDELVPKEDTAIARWYDAGAPVRR